MTRTGASTGTQTPVAGHAVDAKGRSTHGGGRLEEAFVTRVLEASDLLAVIGTRVSLKKAGTQFVGLCPFHTEKSPSFSVSPSRGYYHCFGCGAGGDALSFLMAYDGLPFRDAVESLASAAGIAMPRADDAAPCVTRHELAAAFDALEAAARFYERSLRAAPHAIAYARGRGLVGETARRYRLGYAPAGWHALSAALPGYGHSPAVVDAGLVVEKDGRRYDRFRDRLIFPVRDLKGRVVAFGGRVVDDAEPKYLNSPETPIFRKSEVLFGLFEAHSALRSQRGPRTLFVVEGYMDVLALSQGGVPGAVATMGTALSGAHIAQLRRLASEVVFVFDGDAAGDKAARAALEASLPCAASGTLFSFVRLPDGLDPDDVIQRDGRDSWMAQPRVALCDFLKSCARGSRDLSSAEDRAAFLTEGKRLALLLPQGSDLRRVVMADLHRAVGLESPVRTSVNARPPAGACRFSGVPATGGNPLAATANRPAPAIDAYVRIREACERQPARTAALAADIVAHLERMFGRDAPGDAAALPTEAAALLDYVQYVLTARKASEATHRDAPSPTDVAILDNVHGVLEGLEEANRARLETACLAAECGRESCGPAG